MEEREKKRNREELLNRPRQWQLVDSDEEKERKGDFKVQVHTNMLNPLKHLLLQPSPEGTHALH